MTKGKPKQGLFKPNQPKKYKGDPTNIVYRSGWELKVMKYLDDNSNVVEWSSEELVIPYRSPVDNKIHRYFPDFIIWVKSRDGSIRTIVLEIKPKSQTREPKKPARQTKKYITEVMTWGINQSKWKSAEEYCRNQGWDFRIVTEDHLGIKYK
jgi:hypothetical protein